MAATKKAAEPTLEELQAELAETKRKLRQQRVTTVQVAQKYAAAHNLCSVVDQALTEAGLLGGSISRQVEMLVPVTVVMGIDSDLVENMTEEEIKTAISEMAKPTSIDWSGTIGPVTSVANGRLRRQEPITSFGEVQVVSISEAPDAVEMVASADGYARWANPPQGLLALYSAPEGRKIHFVGVSEYDNNQTTNVTIEGLTFHVSRTPICGADMGYNYGGRIWQLTSPRQVDVGRSQGICLGCREVALRRHGWSFTFRGVR